MTISKVRVEFGGSLDPEERFKIIRKLERRGINSTIWMSFDEMYMETSSCSRDQSFERRVNWSIRTRRNFAATCSQTLNFWSLPWASLTSSYSLHLLSFLNNLERIETGTIYTLSQTFWVEMSNLSRRSLEITYTDLKQDNIMFDMAHSHRLILQSSPKGTKLDAILHSESLSRPSSLSPSLTSLETIMRNSIVADFREKNDVLFRACSRTDM
ncbi:hypothetical protein EV424DRAFT_1545508 [Suillus variegatus]|nr:hypothetical protein EV424DRAFT_1545508 [Suillus variegatus]